MAANSGVIEGQDLLVYINIAGTPTPVAHCKTCSCEINTETRDRVSKDTGKWKGRKAGLLDWKASVEALAVYDGCSWHTLVALQIAREPVTIKFAGRDAVDDNDNWTPEEIGDTYYEGNAIITGLPLTAPNNDDATLSCNFESDGELTPKTVAA